MSNSYKDPEELLRCAIKAGNQKQKNELIAEALNMYKHKDYETEQRNKGTNNNKAINNNIQHNVAAGPNNGQAVIISWMAGTLNPSSGSPVWG